MRAAFSVGSMARRLLPALAALLVGGLAYAWLDGVNPPFMVTDDGIRDQLLVRDCTDLDRCHLIGAPTRLAGIYQGAVWLDLLAAVRWLGGDTAAQRVAVLGLLAAAAATQFVVVWRWLYPVLALPAALLLVAALGSNMHPSLLVNGSAAAFPDVIVAAGLLCHCLSGQMRYLLIAAFALGAAVNVHVGSASLAPPLVAVALLARPRAWGALLAAAAVVLATCHLTSSAALRHNLLALAGQGRLLPALAGAVIVILLSAAAGAAFRRRSWDQRAWIIGASMVVPFGAAALWLVWQGNPFAVSYLHPILAPAAVLVAACVALPCELGARRIGAIRWLPSMAAAGAVGLAVWKLATPLAIQARLEPSVWTLAEASAIAEHAGRRGWSYEDLVFRLQSRSCRELLSAMAVAAPPPAGAPARGRAHLQVVRIERAKLAGLPAAGEVVGVGADPVAALREVDSWLDPTRLRACRRPPGAAGPSCADAERASPEGRDPARFLFSKRSLPEIHALDVAPPYVASYEIPLLPTAGEVRELAILDPADRACTWRITRVEGLRADSPLPAARVRLSADGDAPGLLVIERNVDSDRCALDDARYPPCLFEAAPGDGLAALVVAP